MLTIPERKCWSKFLPLFQMAQNSHYNSTLGMSSFEALTGRCIAIPISIATSSNSYNEHELHETFDIKKLFDHIIKAIFLSKNKSIKIRSRAYTHRNRLFNKGDLVWLYVPAAKKIDVNWQGPHSVVRRIGKVCYAIQPILMTQKEIFVHISRLKKCTAALDQLKNT